MEIDQFTEQRINIKFLVKLGKNYQEIAEMLRVVYGDNAMKKTAIFKWIKRFKEGREDATDDARIGRPSTSCVHENIDRVRRLVLTDRRKTVRMIAEELNLGKSTVHTILTEHLGLRKVCAKIVPKLLTPHQKLRRVECVTDWKNSMENDVGFLNRVITGDESWFFEYDPESKSQSMEWKATGEARTKKSRKSRSKIKVMILVFFDIKGVVHHEFLPEEQTVNSEFYLNVLKRLRDRVRRVRPHLTQNDGWILHQDNAPAHSALIVRQFLAKNSITILDHPPYSPDLAPCDFFLFPKCKNVMRGQHWEDVDTIKQETTRRLKSMTFEDFQGCFEEWKRRWDKCIAVNGEYFEGDKINVDEIL